MDTNPEEYEEETYNSNRNDTEEDYDYNSNVMHGERQDDINSVDRIFNTEAFIYAIKKTLLGWEFSENQWKAPEGGCQAVARTKTINQITNSMRSFITTTGMLANMDDDAINFNMIELNKMIIFMLYDDPMVDKEDDSNETEYITNLVDHSVNMFMGIIRGGQGSEAARQILSGNYLRLNEKKQEQYNPALRVGTSNFDLFTLGGKRR